jgi:hypothetical protein
MSVVAVAAAVMAAPTLAQAAPDATITFSGGSVAFIAGVKWGSGTLTYHGHRYPLKVSGLGFGAIGASGYSASGTVSHLHSVKDIEGVYGAMDASATAGSGAGIISMSNGNGVQITVTSTTSGLKLSLAPSGVNIALK